MCSHSLKTYFNMGNKPPDRSYWTSWKNWSENYFYFSFLFLKQPVQFKVNFLHLFEYLPD